MKKIVTTFLILFSISSHADIYWGVGYSNISDEDDGDELSLGALELTVGNKVENMSVELTVAQGSKDDTYDGIDIEMDTSYYGKVLYHFSDNLFVNAFWGRIELEGCYEGTCATAGETESGFGLGVDIPTSSDAVIRFSFDKVDEADIVSLKYIF